MGIEFVKSGGDDVDGDIIVVSDVNPGATPLSLSGASVENGGGCGGAGMVMVTPGGDLLTPNFWNLFRWHCVWPGLENCW